MATEYVLLVHGTWTDTPGWHKFDENRPGNFASKLNAIFVSRGFPPMVEKDANGLPTHFSWSGANDHKHRLEAGRNLAEHIKKIRDRDHSARIHLVAHSHGCNVVLKAVEFCLADAIGAAELVWEEIVEVAERLKLPPLEAVRKAAAEFSEKDSPRLLAAMRNFDSDVDNFLSDIPKDVGNAMALRVLLRHAFVRAWLKTDGAIQLGRLAFLGPPFLRKFWINRTKWSKAAIKVGDFIGGMGIAISIVYLLCLLLWSTFVALLFLPSMAIESLVVRWPDPNPFNWNPWLLAIGGLLAAATGLAGGAISAEASRRINTNLYFDRRWFSTRDAEIIESLTQGSSAIDKLSGVLPLSCLTVTAELLDEVMLGFSSEPIVFGALLPPLQEMVKPNFSLRLPPVPLGHEPGFTENLARGFYVARRLLFACLKQISSPLYRVWQRRLSVNLMRLITSTAFGIPLYEIRKAIVKASNKIEEPDIFDEAIWDVTKHLARGASAFEDDQEREKRYSFLWNNDEFLARKNTSKLWARISKYEKEIVRHYGSYAAEFEGDEALSKACVILEERTKEAIGAVGLTHLAYHSDLTICEAVADFIATGKLPDQAKRQVTAPSS